MGENKVFQITSPNTPQLVEYRAACAKVFSAPYSEDRREEGDSVSIKHDPDRAQGLCRKFKGGGGVIIRGYFMFNTGRPFVHNGGP